MIWENHSKRSHRFWKLGDQLFIFCGKWSWWVRTRWPLWSHLAFIASLESVFYVEIHIHVSAASAAAMMMLIHSKDIWPLDWPLCGVSIEIMLSVMPPVLLRADHMIVWNYCRLLLGSIIILFENSNNKGSSVWGSNKLPAAAQTDLKQACALLNFQETCLHAHHCVLFLLFTFTTPPRVKFVRRQSLLKTCRIKIITSALWLCEKSRGELPNCQGSCCLEIRDLRKVFSLEQFSLKPPAQACLY